MAEAPKRGILAWALIDWGNSAFALGIMTAFFPIVFKDSYSKGMSPEQSTWWLGIFNSASSLVIAILAPLLGSIADQGNGKKKFLLAFTLLGVASTFGLSFASRGDYLLAGIIYALGSLGFSGNNMFYDSLITDVAEARDFDRVSSLGYAAGYLGSTLLFLVNAHMVSHPEFWGLASAEAALGRVFLTTGLWWLVFSLPALFLIKESPAVPQVSSQGGIFSRALSQLKGTFKEIRGHRNILLFLAGYMLYIDGVNTVIKMAVDYGKSLNLTNEGMIQALVITQLVAFPATLAAGWLGPKFGGKRSIYAGLLVYAGVCFWAWRMTEQWEFTAMAVAVGLVQGGVQALSRSFYARLIPAEKSGEFFGFYNMLGKFAAVIGPTLMGLTALVTDSRTSILSLLLLFIAGGGILARVKEA